MECGCFPHAQATIVKEFLKKGEKKSKTAVWFSHPSKSCESLDF